MESFPYFIVFSFCSPTLPGLFGSLIYSAMKTIYLPIFAIFFSSRTGNIFTRRYKQPKETNYRQIEKDILDEVMGPKVSVFFLEMRRTSLARDGGWVVMTWQRIRLVQITQYCNAGMLMAKAKRNQNTNSNTNASSEHQI